MALIRRYEATNSNIMHNHVLQLWETFYRFIGGIHMNKRCIAMLLAGGRGRRLKSLTKKIAKPAVPFGGKYRIVDFVLSNCRNSNIDTVGVLTQYQPHVLQEYIGNGEAWDLNRKYGGINILPPYWTDDREKWYEGTAHAIFQNINFIDKYNPDHVLVLSGDHIYKMDYNKMLQQHIDTEADVTISSIQVPFEDANRFGIMSINSNQQIISFEEKPTYPKSNLASMGIYIFRWDFLKQFFLNNQKYPHKLKDFGKDIIPKMIYDQVRIYSYEFSGYWKDVGTVKSYWEANMDLLSKENSVLFNKRDWKIYTVEQNVPPLFLDSSGSAKQSIISEGCEIEGEVENCVLSYGVKIGKGAVVQNSVILPNTVIGSNSFINNTVIDSDIVIQSGSVFRTEAFFDDIQLIDETICSQNQDYKKLIPLNSFTLFKNSQL